MKLKAIQENKLESCKQTCCDVQQAHHLGVVFAQLIDGSASPLFLGPSHLQLYAEATICKVVRQETAHYLSRSCSGSSPGRCDRIGAVVLL